MSVLMKHYENGKEDGSPKEIIGCLGAPRVTLKKRMVRDTLLINSLSKGGGLSSLGSLSLKNRAFNNECREKIVFLRNLPSLHYMVRTFEEALRWDGN